MTPYLQQKTLFGPQIYKRISNNLGIVVVIPAYNETYLLRSLMSLYKCDLPICDVEIIVIVNSSERDDMLTKINNRNIAQQAREWAAKINQPKRWFHILLYEDLPQKHGGVGLARKIGMDEASYRFEKIRNPNGIIACFDADSRCDKNYLIALHRHFQQHPKTPACSIYFEHPLSGIDFEEEVYKAISLYELHLRYYINAQSWAGFPWAYQTIGSSMAVRCKDYQKQGGMNRRKAGEDFYFIHKFTPLGHFTTLNTSRIIPSPRPSNRVPFGTGRAIANLLKSKKNYKTYAPQSFVDLKHFFEMIHKLVILKEEETKEKITESVAKLPKSIQAFLKEVYFLEKWNEIRKNTKLHTHFQNRFFRWFNAFMVMKWMHFARDNYYKNVEVSAAAKWLLEQLEENVKSTNPKELLLSFRKRDKSTL